MSEKKAHGPTPGYDGSSTPTGSLKEHDDPALAEVLALSPEERAAAERKLVRKIDMRLIPWMTLLYLMSFLDRVNIGTAKLWHLSEDLGLDSHMYSNASMIFFVSYVAFELPSNLVIKKLRPSIYIPATMVIWAIFQIFMGLVTNYSQLLALRFCLGLAEAGLFPGLNFYLNGWYKREELSRRTAVFFGGAVLAGAFGGIFGYALGQMDGVGGKSGWSWIFIIEGLLTLVIALLSFGMIQDWPDTAKFLTDFERQLVLVRLNEDSGLSHQGSFTWEAVRRGFKDWKTYIYMLCYCSSGVCIYSQSLFAPTIVKSLGTWTTSQSLLLTVPPYAVAFIALLITAWISDKVVKRAPFNLFWSFLALVGYILLATVPLHHYGVLYFAVFLTTMSIAPLIVTTITWCGNNSAGHYKKATVLGLFFSAGNSGGIISSQAYRAADGPRFLPGHLTAMSFSALAFVTTIILYFGLRAENQRREKIYGPPPAKGEVQDYADPAYRAKWGLEGLSPTEIANLGDDHPAFRYIL